MGAPFQVTLCPGAKVWLNPLVWVLWILDFAIWLITLIGPIRMVMSWFKGSTVHRDGDIRRHALAKDGLRLNPSDNKEICTIYDCYQFAYNKWATKACQGVRSYIGVDYHPKDVKQTRPIKVFGETNWNTFAQAGPGDVASHLGAGFVHAGLRPGVDKVMIFEETCKDWALTLQGCVTQNLALATSYATLGIDSVKAGVDECACKAVVCNYKDAQKVADMAANCPSKPVVVYTYNYISKEDRAKNPIKNLPAGVKAFSMDELIKVGKENPCAHNPPKASDNAVIMYTSGSTGKPKGVMLQHSNLTAAVAGFEVMASEALAEGQGTYLSYLPMAHILALIADITMSYRGMRIGYADPKTISAKGAFRLTPDGRVITAPDAKYPPGAIQEYAPSFFCAVPKIWDLLKKGVEEKIGASGPVVQTLFQAAYSARYFAMKQGRDTPLFNLLVFKKVRKMVGGNLIAAASGGGPLSTDVQLFIRIVFGCPLVQGYGLTETCAVATNQPWEDLRGCNVGGPNCAAEVKVESCTEIKDAEGKPYLSTDTKHLGMPCGGRGEVLIRGPTVAAGYYGQEEISKEVFQADGWFRTGDIALWTSDSTLMIIDRVKNLVKLKGGEYIALEAMEKEYATSAYVNGANGGCMAYGDGDMDRPILFTQANMAEIKRAAAGLGIDAGLTNEELCQNVQIEKLVLDDLKRIGKKVLGGNEVVNGVCLIPGTGNPNEQSATSPWTPDNECLTASNKLNRKGVQKMLQDAKLFDVTKQKGVF